MKHRTITCLYIKWPLLHSSLIRSTVLVYSISQKSIGIYVHHRLRSDLSKLTFNCCCSGNMFISNTGCALKEHSLFAPNRFQTVDQQRQCDQVFSSHFPDLTILVDSSSNRNHTPFKHAIALLIYLTKQYADQAGHQALYRTWIFIGGLVDLRQRWPLARYTTYCYHFQQTQLISSISRQVKVGCDSFEKEKHDQIMMTMMTNSGLVEFSESLLLCLF